MTDVSSADREFYRTSRDWIEYSLHELPAGVLWGADGATPSECQEMLRDLDAFARFCEGLGLDDHADFLEGSRWHFDHYPHYLGRRQHFVDYATYVEERGGPLRVPPPPSPAWFLRRGH